MCLRKKEVTDLWLKYSGFFCVCPKQGMITLVLDCIDRLNVYNTAAHFSEYAGEEAAESWKEIVNLLYELLGKFKDLLIYFSTLCPYLLTCIYNT